jgi:hypothetical protein
MNFLLRLSPRSWIIALICASGFLCWIDAVRLRRVEYISGLAEPAMTVKAASPTGYTAGLRRLIVPEHNNGSYQWIAQTQQMLARGEWRVRHVDYDNAPFGREVRSSSPYRWWLGLVAWCDHAVSGRPLGLAVERAALWADPLLHWLLLIGAVIFTARQFGTFPAALLAVGLTLAFPFTGTFLPGQPNDGGLTHLCALWSVLLLLAGVGLRQPAGQRSNDPARARRTQSWFFAAGVAGGLGLWVNTPRTTPILAGIAVGGIIAAWLARRASTADSIAPEVAPWRAWALGGAVTSLAAYLVEYFPTHLGELSLETVHPLYGLAWLGTGELLEQAAGRLQRKNPRWQIRQVAILLLAVLAVAAVPVVMMRTGARGIGTDDTIATRLTNLPHSPVAQNLWTWIYRDGFTATAIVTMLPLLLLGPALWTLAQRKAAAAHRQAIALALGPVLVALALACFQLSWWSLLDGVLLSLLVAATSALESHRNPKLVRWLWSGGLALVLAPAAVLLVAATQAETGDVVAEGDVEALIERDLAYWLANQAGPGGAVVLAPPSLTTSLYFHGGLTGLGTPYWENKEGFAAAVRIAGATSPEEAQAVAQRRHLDYIILPSWDPFMDEYARLGSGRVEHSLIDLLHQWLPPRWLRPLPYHLPKIPGFEGWSVAIFQVIDVQDNPTALSRLAEYFVEMEQLDQAALVRQALERLFPSDLGALVARALVAHACGDAAGFADAISEFPTHLGRGEDNALPWDRRVSLAIALTEGRRFDVAREQTKRCLAEVDEARVRSLTTVSLYRLQVISKAFGLGISDPRLHTLARELLPVKLRSNL